MITRAALRREISRQVGRQLAALLRATAPAQPEAVFMEPAAPPPVTAKRMRRTTVTGAAPGGASGTPQHTKGTCAARPSKSVLPRINAGPGATESIPVVCDTAKAPVPAAPFSPPVTTDRATIRLWGLEQGLRIAVMGALAAHDIALINNRRRLLGNAPFVPAPEELP
jgi:hypothetical protein